MGQAQGRSIEAARWGETQVSYDLTEQRLNIHPQPTHQLYLPVSSVHYLPPLASGLPIAPGLPIVPGLPSRARLSHLVCPVLCYLVCEPARSPSLAWSPRLARSPSPAQSLVSFPDPLCLCFSSGPPRPRPSSAACFTFPVSVDAVELRPHTCRLCCWLVCGSRL